MAGLAGLGLTVLQIDRDGNILWGCNTRGRDIQSLTNRANPSSKAVVWPRWNKAFWALAVEANGEPGLVSLIDDGLEDHNQPAIAVVLRLEAKPHVLDVCLITTESLGIDIDPLWHSLLGRGRLIL